jgi:beta-lactamase class A
MFYSISRRAALGGAALLLPGAGLVSAGAAEAAPWRILADLEKQSGTRIGVMAIDTANGNALFYRENERFLMCSTFKLVLAATVLAKVDAGGEQLDRLVRYQQSDLLNASPITTANLASGMTIAALCEAAVTVSDNSAANQLLASIGGPASVTAFLRKLGDESTRLDRNEPTLNNPDGDKDTTTPSAMLGDLKMILLGDTLTPASRIRLLGWLWASTTGKARLRAGLPSGWQVGDKTGTGDTSMGDLAIVTPPGRKPILITSYVAGGKGSTAEREAVFANVGKLIATTLGVSAS